jgi:hypothetical protein
MKMVLSLGSKAIGAATAAGIALMALSAPSAQANPWHHNHGGGGVVVIGPGYPGYYAPPPPVYYAPPPPVYYAPPPPVYYAPPPPVYYAPPAVSLRFRL